MEIDYLATMRQYARELENFLDRYPVDMLDELSRYPFPDGWFETTGQLLRYRPELYFMLSATVAHWERIVICHSWDDLCDGFPLTVYVAAAEFANINHNKLDSELYDFMTSPWRRFLGDMPMVN